MHLESTGSFNLGLLMFFANHDIRYIKKIVLQVHNQTEMPLSIFSDEVCESASAEAEIVINQLYFKVSVDLDCYHWEMFIRTFFMDEVPMVSGTAEYVYKNNAAFDLIKHGYGIVLDQDGADADIH